MLNFAERGRHVFRASSALEREELKSKGKGAKTIHFKGIDETIELILRTIISVNQLNLCEELAAGKPAEKENSEPMVIPTEFPTANRISQTGAEVQRRLLREYEQKFAELLQQKLSKLCSNAGVDKGQFFITLDEEGLDEMKTSCREYTLLRSEETSRVRGGFVETRRSAQSWMLRSAIIKDVTRLRSWSNLCFETEQFLG